MSPASVEYLLTQDARLLARRDSTPAHPAIDAEIEDCRQAALDLYFKWQDGAVEFQELTPFVVILERKVELNRTLIKWLKNHEDWFLH